MMIPKNKILVGREIEADDIIRCQQILEDNGIEPDEVDTVMQAIGYALLDEEFYEGD